MPLIHSLKRAIVTVIFHYIIQVFRLVNTDVSEVIANSGISLNNMDILSLIIDDLVRG